MGICVCCHILMLCSLSFLEDQGIDLIRPSPELAEVHSQANSMSEAEVLSALQVGIHFCIHFFTCSDSPHFCSCLCI